MNRLLSTCLIALLWSGPLQAADPVNEFAAESSRDIPVAYDVDVVVVGGSTGAVQAAISAANNGASVFLATPRSFLGDDMTATLRLWPEDGDKPTTPLAHALYHGRRDIRTEYANAISYTYQANVVANKAHAETAKPSRLIDGVINDAVSGSVQYDGDVEIVADLGKTAEVTNTHVLVYQRRGGFEVRDVVAFTSDDGNTWTRRGQVRNALLHQGNFEQDCIPLTIQVNAKARYVKFAVAKTDHVERMLLGEIVIQGTSTKNAKSTETPLTTPTPLLVKRTLDQALLDANVKFLFWSYTTDLVYTKDGKIGGVVISNRGGRQAVLGKIVIDATDRGYVARMAGAESKSYPTGMRQFKRVVIGGEAVEHDAITSHRTIHPPFNHKNKTYPIHEYTLKLPMPDASHASWSAAEQLARNATWHSGQQFTSEVLFEVVPDPIIGKQSQAGSRTDPADLDINAFRPKSLDRVYVLGGSADITREQAAGLARPTALIAMGDRIGQAAAAQAATIEKPASHVVRNQVDGAKNVGSLREMLVGVRPIQSLPTIPQTDLALPIIGKYDVVVIGGGTSGSPAGIGAGRHGAKTLVVEYQYGLGGVGTMGAISKYWYGYRKGFTGTVLDGSYSWGIQEKMEWWRTNLLDAGADIWFGTLGCGAVVDKDNKVCGVVVATPQGRGVVLSEVVIDSTGNSDIAAAAGAQVIYIDDKDIAMQGTGLPPRNLGASYTNTDFTFTDETDMMDVWNLFVTVRKSHGNAFDSGKFIDTRERRRIVGDYTLNVLDVMNKREYPDVITMSSTNFDTHGYTIDPFFTLTTPSKRVVIKTYTPYRCLLPKGLNGILVTGLGTSAHRDVVPVIRMQADLQNEGYGAGVAAAHAIKADVPLRKVDLRAVQKHLVEIEALPEAVLFMVDTYPMPPEQVEEAAVTVKNNYNGVGVLLAHPKQSVPLLKEAYGTAANSEEQLIYAQVLGVLGDSTGLDAIIEHVSSLPKWDRGWNFTGMGQFGSSMSKLDSYIYALAYSGDKRILPVLIDKARMLDASHEFSHHRAIARAFEMIADTSAAPVLAQILRKPKMISTDPNGLDRGLALREITLARALFRCGDHEGLGREILEKYRGDLRGHLARHAHAILEAAKNK